MAAWIKQLLALPVFPGDREKTRKANILNITLLVIVLDFCLQAPFYLFKRIFPAAILQLIIIVICLLFLSLLRRGRVRLVGNVILIVAFLVVTIEGFGSGSIMAPTTTNYLLIILLSGLIFEWRGILVSVVATSLVTMAFIPLQNASLLPAPSLAITPLRWYSLTIAYMVIGGIGFYINQVLHKALLRAEKEIADRERFETVLERQVEENKKLQAELREQSLRDPLTGLYNRRYLAEILERELVLAEREQDHLSIIVSDVDLFKQINDTSGHQAGDQVLREIANLLNKYARRSDIICRYGGEEFLLVLPGSTLEAAAKCADEIRQKCADLIIRYDQKALMITMSFGVASYPTHGQQAEEIMIKADLALYKSKSNGRNQVTVWNEDLAGSFS